VMPEWEHCQQVNAILGRALSKDPGARHQSCLELSDDLSAVQIGTYDALAESLATLVRSNHSADWRQVARLTSPARKSGAPRSMGESHRLAAALPLESAPAFASGLVTQKPISVTEHTARDVLDREQKRAARRRRRRLAMLPTVLLPAAAIILGLFLGRLGGAGTAPARAPQQVLTATNDQLVSGSVALLQAHLRECVDSGERREAGSKVELEFGPRGQLAEVRLRPSSLAQTRLGACMLKRVWDTGVSAPAAMSLVIPLGEER